MSGPDRLRGPPGRDRPATSVSRSAPALTLSVEEAGRRPTGVPPRRTATGPSERERRVHADAVVVGEQHRRRGAVEVEPRGSSAARSARPGRAVGLELVDRRQAPVARRPSTASRTSASRTSRPTSPSAGSSTASPTPTRPSASISRRSQRLARDPHAGRRRERPAEREPRPGRRRSDRDACDHAPSQPDREQDARRRAPAAPCP